MIMKFKNIKEFDEWQKDIRRCLTHPTMTNMCPDILDHYFYDEKGKKIRTGKCKEVIAIIIKAED